MRHLSFPPWAACALCASLSAACGCNDPRTSNRRDREGPEGPRPCDRALVATVGGVEVSEADASMIRALVQPPPTHGEAERLAVAVTLAYRVEAASAPMPDIGERLLHYRNHYNEAFETPEAKVQWNTCRMPMPPA